MNKFIEFLSYAFIFVLPWQTRLYLRQGEIGGDYHEYSTISLYLSDILLIVLLAVFFFSLLFKKENREIKELKKYWIAIAFFELFCFVSIFFAPDKLLALYSYCRLLLGIGLFFFMVNARLNKLRLAFVFGISVFLQGFLAIWQFGVQQIAPNKWLGLSEKIPHDLGISVVEAMGDIGFIERWLRSYGSFDHPNILGAYLAFGILFLLIYIFETFFERDFENNEKTVFLTNVSFYLLLIICGFGLLFSFSRSAWLSFFPALFFLLIFYTFCKNYLKIKKLLLGILLIGSVVFLFSLPFSNLLEARLLSKGKLEYISNTERVESLSISKEIIKSNFLWGAGIGNYTLEMEKELVQNQRAYVYQPVHNTFLLILAEIGIFGFFSFALIFIFILTEVYKKLEKKYFFYVLILFYSIVTIFTFDHWFWSLHFGVLFFWFILGLIVSFFVLEKKAKDVV